MKLWSGSSPRDSGSGLEPESDWTRMLSDETRANLTKILVISDEPLDNGDIPAHNEGHGK